jgi:hypothetical protein
MIKLREIIYPQGEELIGFSAQRPITNQEGHRGIPKIGQFSSGVEGIPSVLRRCYRC